MDHAGGETLHYCPVEPDQPLSFIVDLVLEADVPVVHGRDDGVEGCLGDGYADHTGPPRIS
jgi:hypothetical protein